MRYNIVEPGVHFAEREMCIRDSSLTVDWLQLASLELTKTDVYGNLINGAVFRLWNNGDYDKEVTVTNGKIKVDNLTTGIYYLQEKRCV